MFGREARLPIDLSFGVSSDGTSTKSYQRFVKTMQQELKSAYELAEEMLGRKMQEIRGDMIRDCITLTWLLEIES